MEMTIEYFDTFDGNSANANSNTLSIKADFSKTIGVGMSVSGSGLISGTGGSGETIWPTVEDYANNMDGNVSSVTLKPVPGQTNSIGGSNITNGNLTYMGNQLLTVSLDSPQSGQILEYNGTVWANKTYVAEAVAAPFESNWLISI